jgi:hypothetical protein
MTIPGTPSFSGPGVTGLGAAAADVEIPLGVGSLRNFRVNANGLPDTGTSVSIAVVRNGVPTALSCSIGEGQTACSNLVEIVAVAAGDRLSVSFTPTGDVPLGLTYSIELHP